MMGGGCGGGQGPGMMGPGMMGGGYGGGYGPGMMGPGMMGGVYGGGYGYGPGMMGGGNGYGPGMMVPRMMRMMMGGIGAWVARRSAPPARRATHLPTGQEDQAGAGRSDRANKPLQFLIGTAPPASPR